VPSVRGGSKTTDLAGIALATLLEDFEDVPTLLDIVRLFTDE